MKTHQTIVALLVVAVIPSAMAGLVPIGDPFDGASWGQTFAATDEDSFDLVAVQMTSEGDTFETDTFRDMSVDDWSLTAEVDAPLPVLAVAEGPETQELTMDVIFDGEQDNQLEFDFVTLEGDTLTDSVHAEWNGTDWTLTTGTWSPTSSELREPTSPPVVPSPSAVLLGLIGLFVAHAVRRAI